MITTNVINRVFCIKYGDSTGTAFTIDREGRQYLVTARHVVKGITSGSSIAISHKYEQNGIRSQALNMSVDVVGIGAGEIDVAVMACPLQLSPEYLLEPSTAGLTFGQKVYFLGFPFGWGGGSEEANRNFPFPFVKAGIVSAVRDNVLYLDAHNNPGFSGGPVVFEPALTRPRNYREYRVAGIVSNYPAPFRPIFDKEGQRIGYFPENPGLMVAYDIKCATDLIDKNPVGFELPSN